MSILPHLLQQSLDILLCTKSLSSWTIHEGNISTVTLRFKDVVSLEGGTLPENGLSDTRTYKLQNRNQSSKARDSKRVALHKKYITRSNSNINNVSAMEFPRSEVPSQFLQSDFMSELSPEAPVFTPHHETSPLCVGGIAGSPEPPVTACMPSIAPVTNAGEALLQVPTPPPIPNVNQQAEQVPDECDSESSLLSIAGGKYVSHSQTTLSCENSSDTFDSLDSQEIEHLCESLKMIKSADSDSKLDLSDDSDTAVCHTCGLEKHIKLICADKTAMRMLCFCSMECKNNWTEHGT